MRLPTALVPAAAESPTTSADFLGAVLLTDAASRSRVQMEHATRYTALMDHMAAPHIGPDTPMRVGELGGRDCRPRPEPRRQATRGEVDETRISAVRSQSKGCYYAKKDFDHDGDCGHSNGLERAAGGRAFLLQNL